MVQQVGKPIYKKASFQTGIESQNGKLNALYHYLVIDIVIEYTFKLHIQFLMLLSLIRLLTFSILPCRPARVYPIIYYKIKTNF